MEDKNALRPASDVPIVRQHRAFVICDEERRSALREAEQAETRAAEFEAVSVAVHLWQAQQEELSPLLERAVQETEAGYDVQPFQDWIRQWTDEMSEELAQLAERNNSLVATIGNPLADEIGRERALPRLEEIQARADAAEAERAKSTGVLGDLMATGQHDELLLPISRSGMGIEIHETDRVRVRPLSHAEQSAIEAEYSWGLVSLDETGGELGMFGFMSDQDLSDGLHDQFSRPVALGQLPDGETCWIYMGRYYTGGSAGLEAIEAFEQLDAEPLNQAETRAHIEANLPPPRSQLERIIAWAHEPDSDDTTFADVLEHIELKRDVHENDAEEWQRMVDEMREQLTRSREQELLSHSELSQCLQALGLQSARREPIPEAVKRAVWRRDEARCAQCGSQQRLEFDHIVPVVKGGSNTARNLQLLCETCNRSKGATI